MDEEAPALHDVKARVGEGADHLPRPRDRKERVLIAPHELHRNVDLRVHRAEREHELRVEAPQESQRTFDPRGVAPAIANFDEIGRALLWHIQRELLTDPDDGELRALLDELLAMPTAAPHWRDVDLSVPSEPVLVVHLRHGDVELRFVTMVTAFQAPQSVAVEALRVEMWFPSDDATAARFRALVDTPA